MFFFLMHLWLRNRLQLGDAITMLPYRYCNKSHLHDIHQQSKAFKDFKGWCAENEPYVVKAGQGAFPTGLGHWMRVQKGTIQ